MADQDGIGVVQKDFLPAQLFISINANIVFIAIARNTESELLKYFTNNTFDYQQTIVTDTIRSLFDYYFPRNVVIDKNGIVVGDYVGFAAEFTEPQLDKTISGVLKKER